MNEKELRRQIQQLCKHQRFAVIATHNDKQSYAHLVAFTSTSDLRVLLFATKRDTQKYYNIKKNVRIAVLIDNRENSPFDFSDAITVTALGNAKEAKNSYEEYRKLLLEKHPDLSMFLADPLCTLIEVHVKAYQVVQKFEQVQILKIADEV
ncbi:hypothetical protein AYK25_00755 [Thermoplasmatales archaeon SM1-50]|nr:MAG: hypothetical protein AYK25_00755 [Thermoplasmatales archaeon SM1-50]